MEAKARFKIASWEETPWDEGGAKGQESRLTRAAVRKTFSGDLDGESRIEYLMAHRADGSAQFVGMERFTGRLGERSGGFVLQHTGTFEGGVATAFWMVVPGSGDGELEGLRGEGGFSSGHAEEYDMVFEYDFEAEETE